MACYLCKVPVIVRLDPEVSVGRKFRMTPPIPGLRPLHAEENAVEPWLSLSVSTK